MRKPKCYLAAPFFNKEQILLVESLEKIITDCDWELFSPRKGTNAVEMNRIISYLKEWEIVHPYDETIPRPPVPSASLRAAVFHDNCVNIDDADLVLAVIDDFDTGVMFEIGYAYKAHVPIVTHSARDYGCNLMLAQSIIGHTKYPIDVERVLRMGYSRLAMDVDAVSYGEAIAEIQTVYKSELALMEGPSERHQ